MAPRAHWKGYLKLSLVSCVSCPIQLFPAISRREKIKFHQINRKTGNRIKFCKLDAVTGKQVNDEDIVKGYEIGKGRYVEITDGELEAVTVGSAHTIAIDRFVPRSEIDELYRNIPYYTAPAGEVGWQAFAVIREAIKKKGMAALGHVVFTTREHVIALEPRGMLGVTLRYPYEIRKEADYFGDIPEEKVPKDMLDLAVHIVETRAGHFEPEKFEDHYETAFKELIKRKRRGEKIEKPRERQPAEVIDLMDALRQSAAAKRGDIRAHPRLSASDRQRTSAYRSTSRRRKAS